MAIDIKQELNHLGYGFEVEGNNVHISKFSSITEAGPTDVSFCYYEGDRAINYVSKSNAGIILCRRSMIGKIHPKAEQQFYFLDNPRLVFVQLLKKFNDAKIIREISSHTILHDSSKIGKNCYIGHYSIIDQNCIIGDNCIIGNRVSLKNCIIGNNCIVQSGTTAGEDGFAYERYDSGKLQHFPHMGKVVISDDVEICANCSIARGSLTDTIIGSGTKIDALVHIAHNVKLGRNCELTAGTIVGGSTIIGNSTWTGLNSTLKDNIRIGNNVIVGAGAMVIKDVEDKDVVAGVPAKSIKNKINTNLTYLMAGQKD